MENASRALIMAGSVLISLLVISVLVFFFNNMREWQTIGENQEELEVITEFNKQYDVYERNVYGSELLSLVNKIADYNKREAENKGYQEIELVLILERDLDSEFFKKGTYNSEKIKSTIEKLQNKIDQIGNETIDSTVAHVSRKVSKLATMRTDDIENLGFTASSYRNKVTQYLTYSTLLTDVKAKIFKYDSSKYDNKTGRIIELKYKF